jgi:uncharacterized protein (TIGR02453 family)
MRARINPNLAPTVPPPEGPPISFGGFSEETWKFLRGLKKNNNKAWFEAHREDYDLYLREPSRAFVQAMDLVMREHDLPLVANIKTSLFRINRDIRFSKDKSPYKTHIGFSFPVQGVSQDMWSGLYVAFEVQGAKEIHAMMGGGVYQPMPPQLKALRKKISGDFKTFKALLNDKAFKKEFPEGVSGESLKKAPQGFDESDPAIEYLKMKQFLFGATLEADDFLDERLPKKLMKKFSAGAPMALFLGT